MDERRRRAYVSCRARCPFYLYQANKLVACDGTGVARKILTVFDNEAQRNEFLRRYCIEDFARCGEYRRLLAVSDEAEGMV